MNQHEKKMLALITAANDAGKPVRGVASYAREHAALEKLEAAGTILCVPEVMRSRPGNDDGLAYGYVVAGHPITQSPNFKAALVRALRDAEMKLRSAQRDIAHLETLIARNA